MVKKTKNGREKVYILRGRGEVLKLYPIPSIRKQPQLILFLYCF
jgi:hypothetical protein